MKTHPPHYSGCEKFFVITVISYSVQLIYYHIVFIDIAVINTFLHSFSDFLKITVPAFYLIAPFIVNAEFHNYNIISRRISNIFFTAVYKYLCSKFIAVFLYTFI